MDRRKQIDRIDFLACLFGVLKDCPECLCSIPWNARVCPECGGDLVPIEAALHQCDENGIYVGKKQQND